MLFATGRLSFARARTGRKPGRPRRSAAFWRGTGSPCYRHESVEVRPLWARHPSSVMSRALRPSAALGLSVSATAIAAIGLARYVVLPILERADALVDANLAKALAQPIHFRLAEIVLAAALVAFVLLPRWTRSRLAGGLAMVTVAAAAAWRALLLPALYTAWSHADLVAGRPLDRLQAAQHLDDYEQAMGLGLMGLFAMTMWIGLRGAEALATDDSTVTATAPTQMSAAGTIDVAADPAPV